MPQVARFARLRSFSGKQEICWWNLHLLTVVWENEGGACSDTGKHFRVRNFVYLSVSHPELTTLRLTLSHLHLGLNPLLHTAYVHSVDLLRPPNRWLIFRHQRSWVCRVGEGTGEIRRLVFHAAGAQWFGSLWNNCICVGSLTALHNAFAALVVRLAYANHWS